MTKKLLIILLTLCLAVVGMTVIAAADAPTSITIGETTLSNGSTISGGNGTATYQDGVLILNNFTIVDKTGYDGISSGGDLTIKFSGENSITAEAGDGIYVYGSLTIIGSEGASLTVSGLLGGIKTKGGNKISISDSVITTNGISSGDSVATIAVENSTIVSTEEIYASSSITISGDVDITASEGIAVSSGSITITPSTGGILEVTVGSTTSYYSEATSLGTLLSGTVTIKTHTHSYVNNECACGAKDYGTIEVGYVTLKDGQYAIVDGSSMTVYDGTPSGTSYAYFSGGVLYLNNYLYRDGIFYTGDDLTINLTGTSFVTYVSAYGNLSISGTGSLTAAAEDYYDATIFANGDITIEGVTVDITSDGGSATAIESRGSVTISGSDVTLSASITKNLNAANAIDAWGDIIIDNGSTLTATASSTGENGIALVFYAYGSISITDSTVTKIEASGYAGHTIYAQTGSITITNSTVNTSASATAQDYSTDYFAGRAIYAEAGNVTITESTVTASATGQKSYAVCAGGDVAVSGESTVTTTATSSLEDGYSFGIYVGGTATVAGESTVTVTVTAIEDSSETCGIYAIGNIAITGSSTVSSTATGGFGFEGNLAIHSYTGSIDITGSEVTVNVSGYNSYGAISTYGANADITITDSKITATLNNTDVNNIGAFGAIGNGSDVIISGSDITVTSTAQSWDWGTIYSNGFVSISDSNIYAKSTSKATYGVIRAETGVTISGSEVEFITSGTDFAYAIYVLSGDLEIESSDVTLTATSTTKQSAINMLDGDIILTPGTGEALEVTLGTNNPVYHYSATTVTDNAWSSYGYVKIAVSTHTHSYTSSVTTKATCTDDGVMTYTCACGDSYTEAISATGHTEVTDEAVEPTCTETGLTEGSHCSVCNEVIVEQEVVAALGHDYEISYFTWADGYKSATATFACANCSDEQTVNATVSVENYYGMYVYVATARYGASGATYSSVKTVGTVDMSGLETNSTSEITTEEVETTEPVEGTDTETEADEEPEPSPGTGLTPALIPMALAFAVNMLGKKK